MNSEGRPLWPGSPERDRNLETADVAALMAFLCAAPQHVAIGNVTVWPLSAVIRAEG